MIVTPEIVQHEFVGCETKVVKSTNRNLVGIAGKVIDETRNTFTLYRDGEQKVVIKDTAVFDFTMSDGTVVEIDGKVIMGRPEERLKHRPRRLW